MRKFIAKIMILALAISCFSAVAFATPTTNVYMGDGSSTLNATSNTIDIDVYIKPSAEMIQYAEYLMDTVSIPYTVTNAQYETTGVTLSGLTNASGTSAFSYANITGYAFSSDAFKIGTIKLTRAEGVETSVITIDANGSSIYVGNEPCTDITYQNTLTITWPSSAPDPEVTGTSTTAQGTTFGNYKDVPLFKYEATVSNATESTKFYMTPELFLNGTSAGTKAKTLIPGLTVDGEGKIVVNIAIVGAPEGTVTINPNITAE